MQGSYPLSRCPACKKVFRTEIEDAETAPDDLGLFICPYCGFMFKRFEMDYLNSSARQPVTH